MKFFSRIGKSKGSNETTTSTATAYTKEIPYIPSYHWVQATEYTPSTTEDQFAKAKYIIHNITNSQVYEAYKAIFIKDGWAITHDVEFFGFTAEKDTHLANVSTINSDKDVILTVFAQLKAIS